MPSALRLRLPRAALLAWLALFGLVAAPSISRALAAADPLAYAAVCSAIGSADPANAASTAHAGDACGLCALSALPLVPSMGPGGIDLQGPATPVLAAPSQPQRASAWRIARSRAPPRCA